MGKTGLIRHCLHKKEITRNFYPFFIDIYATKSLRDFTFVLGKVVFEQLKSFGRKAIDDFWKTVKSFQAGISFDVSGNPVVSIGLGDIHNPELTLEEIFQYIAKASKPCLIALDEFQQIALYPEKNIEALLRTHIQQCNNARFIFAGSQRHVLGNMFLSASRPFYQSVSMMSIDSIDLQQYIMFAQRHFTFNRKKITTDAIERIYSDFDGITWYLQKILHTLYNMTAASDICKAENIREAVDFIVDSNEYAYSEMLFRLPEKQKELLVAIAKEGEAQAITSSVFVKKHKLASASSVQAALKGLLGKDFITQDKDTLQVYDRFFAMWLKKNY
jgi:AAA+ ATPase superfamily predicted ATPase